MRTPPALLLVLALAAPAAARETGPAGVYRLSGEPDVASQIALRRDGRFQYFLMAGALDEQAQGRWRVEGDRIVLTTEPKPVPPVFTRSGAAKAVGAPLSVKVSWPDGRGVALVDLRVGFDEGEPVYGYTQEEGWSLPAEETRTPRWIELKVPMHEFVSPRFPIDVAAANALAFTLTPNDLGIVDFGGIRVEQAAGSLIVERGGARLRYERMKTAR